MMDFKTEVDTLSLYESGNFAAECAVDGDYLLPDYCPDIAAVLKCTMSPAVLARRHTGDKLLVEGEATIRILYLDEARKCVRTFECVQPFDCVMLYEEQDGIIPYVTARVNYLNCRATSPRRITVHGTLSVCGTGRKKRIVEHISDVKGDTVHCKRDTVVCSELVGSAEKNFSVKETVDLGVSKPPAECIIRTDCTATVDAVKLLNDKVVTKGKVLLRTLYTVNSVEGTTACTVHEFPFSQIVDMAGITEQNTVNARVDVLSKEVQVVTDRNGNGTLLATNIKLCLFVEAVCDKEMPLVVDAYTCKYPCQTEKTQITAEQQLFSRADTSSLKEILDLPSDSISEIVDLWCEVVSLATKNEAQHSYVDGRIQISLLTRDREGCISYYEHVGDFALQFADACDYFVAEVSVADVDFAVVGGKIEIRFDLCCTRKGYAKKSCNCVCGFETAAEPYAENTAALRICRAKKGEAIWDIAKECHTSVEAVLAENALCDECLQEDMLLLIPLC